MSPILTASDSFIHQVPRVTKKTDNLFLSDLHSLRLLMDGMPAAIGVAELQPGREGGLIRPEGRIIFFNRRWEELLGFGLGEVRTAGESTARLYPDPEYRAQCYRLRQEAVAQAERESRPARPIALKVRVADGSTREFLTGTTVIGNRMVVSMEEMTVAEPAWQQSVSAGSKGGVLAVHRAVVALGFDRVLRSVMDFTIMHFNGDYPLLTL